MLVRVMLRRISPLLVALVPAILQAQETPKQDAPAKVHLYMSDTRALAMLRIGDAAPFPVVFDTGTNGNLVDTGIADRLGLPNTGPSPSIDGSTGKPVPGHDTFIRDARLGGVPIRDARATALAYNETDEVGIFGPNSWPDSYVEMDGPRSRLLIRPKTSAVTPAGTSIPYLGEGAAALPSAILDFGTVKVPAILDSGNDMPIILPSTYKAKLTLEGQPVVIGYAVSAAGRQPISKARLAGSVRIAGVTLNKPEVYFMDGGRPNIGLPVLRRIKVTFDHSSARSWITSNATIDMSLPTKG